MAKKTAVKSARKAAAKKSAPVRKPKTVKYVYFFGGGKADGDRTMKDLLGGKGSGLAEMTNAGLPDSRSRRPPATSTTSSAARCRLRSSRRWRSTCGRSRSWRASSSAPP
jgi:hypothetical protein